MNKHSSHSRRELVMKVIRQNAVRSHEELMKLLRKEGVRVAQPTLSRDLHELGIAKTPAGYVVPGEIAADTPLLAAETRESHLEVAIREFVTSAEKAGTMVVVKTTVAAAQPVARAIDEAGLPEIAGTLGGDDTIFLATRDNASAERVVRRIAAILQPSRSMRRTRA